MLGIFVYFIYKISFLKNKIEQVLLATAYITGAEVFLRMTKAFVFYETGKYAIILFAIIGILYVGFKRKAFPYILYFLCLIPSVLVSFDVFSYDANFRTLVLFNLSGPLCLSIIAVFSYGRTVFLQDFLKILDYIIYPLISMMIYIYLYAPNIQDVITNTASNSALSGGYGPNQVATMLGLGVFILLTRLLIPYKNKLVHWSMMGIMLIMAYRALLTFSRGGVFVAVIMCLLFIIILYFNSNIKFKSIISLKLIGLLIGALMIWSYTTLKTGGLIENRYENKDVLGREKDDLTTGRVELLVVEIDNFKENPFMGVGVGQGKFKFEEELGIKSASHNEISRMLSEHGLFGIFALLVLIFTPIITKLKGRKNIYFLPFLLFWGLTIAHSSMRIAAPAFIYALCLLNIDYAPKNKTAVHRK